MFSDACSRIETHFTDLEKEKCNLFLLRPDGTEQRIGNTESRYLYHKPGTNLYYIQTYDTINQYKKQSLGDMTFVPQMTMRVYAWNALDVMRQLLTYHAAEYTKNPRNVKVMHNELETFNDLYTTTMQLIMKYNTSHKHNISLHTRFGKSIRLYLFFILTKLYMFIVEYLPGKQNPKNTAYLKDYMTYLPRHSNYVMYMRMKQLMKTHFRIVEKKAVQSVIELVYQPQILARLFHMPTEMAAIQNVSVGIDHPDYGNPSVSFLSYFQYFENPPPSDESFESLSTTSHESPQILMDSGKESQHDWLKRNDYDIFSTEYPLMKDALLIENRLFSREMDLFMRNKVDEKMYHFNIKNIRTMVNKIKTTKTRKKRT
jgi:hypothetical protein